MISCTSIIVTSHDSRNDSSEFINRQHNFFKLRILCIFNNNSNSKGKQPFTIFFLNYILYLEKTISVLFDNTWWTSEEMIWWISEEKIFEFLEQVTWEQKDELKTIIQRNASKWVNFYKCSEDRKHIFALHSFILSTNKWY